MENNCVYPFDFSLVTFLLVCNIPVYKMINIQLRHVPIESAKLVNYEIDLRIA